MTVQDTPRGEGRRTVARRSRAAILAAAAALLRGGEPLTMRAVASRAGVSRSTLYRHFADPGALQDALRQEALDGAAAAVARALEGRRSTLAQLRTAVTALVDVGSAFPLELPSGGPAAEATAAVARPLIPLAQRLAEEAELDPVPDDAWLTTALGHFVEVCLRAGWTAPDAGVATVTRLFEAVTDPLDRGLLLLDRDGALVSSNPRGRPALGDARAGELAVVRSGGCFEDGARASIESHPLSLALATREPQHGVRGHSADDGVTWFSIDARPLQRTLGEPPYGFVAVFADVTEQTRFAQAQLRPAGALGATAVPLLDILRVLDEVPPPLLPEQLIAEAMRVASGPVALYVVDVDGSHLLRLAGTEEFPARLRAPLALGPELAPDGLPDLAAHLARELPGVAMAPMWLRGRAVGILLARRGADTGLHEVARLGAAAMELGGGYTDVFDDARRRKDMTPAAEVQQSLLPPRIVRMGSGEMAGSVLPSYEVGGDWFDYVENRDGAWVAIADGAGRGPRAAGLSSVTLAALRAARRNGATLDEAVQQMDETVSAAGGPEFFVTAVVARWHPVYSLFSWVNLGHPPPLLLSADGDAEELATPSEPPLGYVERERAARRHQRRLRDGDRVVLFTDGISRRRTADGPFDTNGIVAAARTADDRSAAATARAIQEAVVSASEDPLPDDAAVVVLVAGRPAASAR